MLHRHQWQFDVGGMGDQGAPDAGAQDHVIRHDRALGGLHAHRAAILDQNAFGRGVGKGLELARRHRFIHQIPCDLLGARRYQTGIGVPHGALDQVFLE